MSVNASSEEFKTIKSLIALLNVIIQVSKEKGITSWYKDIYYKICKFSHIAALAPHIDDLLRPPAPNLLIPADKISSAALVAGRVKDIGADLERSIDCLHDELMSKLKDSVNCHENKDNPNSDDFRFIIMNNKKAHEVATSLEIYIGSARDEFIDALMAEDYPRKLLAPLYPYLDWTYCLVDKKDLQEKTGKTEGRTFMGLMVKKLIGSGLDEKNPIHKHKGWVAYEFQIDHRKRSFFAVREVRREGKSEWSLVFITTNSSHNTQHHKQQIEIAINRL